MTTIEDKNIPTRRGQHLIQVQLIHSLPFVTTMKKNTTTTTTTKILDRIFNAVGLGFLRNKKIPYSFLNTCCPQGITRNQHASACTSPFRLLAVPFWIAKRACEPKTHSATRLERGEINEKTACSLYFSAISRALSTIQKRTASSLLAVVQRRDLSFFNIPRHLPRRFLFSTYTKTFTLPLCNGKVSFCIYRDYISCLIYILRSWRIFIRSIYIERITSYVFV